MNTRERIFCIAAVVILLGAMDAQAQLADPPPLNMPQQVSAPQQVDEPPPPEPEEEDSFKVTGALGVVGWRWTTHRGPGRPARSSGRISDGAPRARPRGPPDDAPWSRSNAVFCVADTWRGGQWHASGERMPRDVMYAER